MPVKPMADRTTVVKTYGNTAEAEMARDRLEEAGIDAFLRKDDAGGMHPQMQLTQGVKLIVHERDVDQADDLLQAFGPADEPVEPVEEMVAATSHQRMYNDLGRALLIMGAIAIIVAFFTSVSGLMGYIGLLGGAMVAAGLGCQAYARTYRKPHASST